MIVTILDMGTTNAARRQATATVMIDEKPRGVPTPEELEEIAAEAIAHRHSVTRRIVGLPVRGAVGARIDAALARRGYRGQ